MSKIDILNGGNILYRIFCRINNYLIFLEIGNFFLLCGFMFFMMMNEYEKNGWV